MFCFFYDHVNGLLYKSIYSQIHIKFRINEYHGFLSQFSTNFHEIFHTLFSIQFVTTLKVLRCFDKYRRS